MPKGSSKITEKFDVVALPDDAKPLAEIYINGKRVPDVRKLVILFPYLDVYYGKGSEGFERIAYRPPGGGGSVYLIISKTPEGEHIFMLLLEDRPNMGGLRWCAPGGGQFDEGSHCEVGKKNLMKKVGLDIEVHRLPGLHGNKDRLFEVADPTLSGEGVHFSWGEVDFSMLREVEGGWVFADGTAPAEMVKCGKALGIMFFTYKNYNKYTGDVTALCLLAKYVDMMLETGGMQWNKK